MGSEPKNRKIMCNEGRIDGAVKFGRDWAIPVDTERPNDKRVVSGKHKGWREKHNSIECDN